MSQFDFAVVLCGRPADTAAVVDLLASTTEVLHLHCPARAVTMAFGIGGRDPQLTTTRKSR